MELENTDYNKTAKFGAFDNALPMIIEKDVNSNITLFLFAYLFRSADDEQRESMAKFVENLKTDMHKFFMDRAKIDFELTEDDVKFLDGRIDTLLRQKLGPIFTDVENYRNG
ncbi:hypothetical protein JZU46_03090, partial [bacterium]|nr:hypothetical protein [bacterium]